MSPILKLIFPFHGIDALSESINSTSNEHPKKDFFEPCSSTCQNNLILFGESSIYRRSLLFQACLSSTRTKRDAVFICKDEFDAFPLPVHNMPKPDKDVLDLIKFKYMQNLEQLVDYFAKLHLEKSLPSMIIIDDLTSFIETSDHEKELDCMRHGMLVCAHLKSALDFINSKTFCAAIVSCRQLEKDFSYRMYFDSFACLKTLEKEKLFEMYYLDKESNKETRIKFTVNNYNICLGECKIIENCVQFSAN